MARSLLDRICTGDAHFILNLLFCPLVLTFQALWIYVVPCFGVWLDRALRFICHPLCFCCNHEDKAFRGQTAIGDASQLADWHRADDLVTKPGKRMKIYEGKIEAKDLCQGAVGDCWLVAALASAAEHPAVIRRAFLTRERNPRGKYRVRLYDGQKNVWRVITIDDRIPCEPGTTNPLFMKANGNELWAILIEKAFAKFLGSYKALDGGWCVWAWRALTGDNVFRLKSTKGGKEWERLDFKNAPSATDKTKSSFYHSDEKYTPDQAWVLINKYLRADSLCAASGGENMSGGGQGGGNNSGLNGEAVDTNGLVGTHAYSILDARELGLSENQPASNLT